MRIAADLIPINDLIVVVVAVAVVSLDERADSWRDLIPDPCTRAVLPPVALAVLGVTDVLVKQPLHTTADNREQAREVVPVLAVDIGPIIAGQVAASAAAADSGQYILVGVTAVLVQAIEAQSPRHDIVAGHIQPAAS